MMEEIIHKLNKAITEDESREILEDTIAKNINEAVITPLFSKLGLDVQIEILDKCDIIDISTISNLINLGHKEYGDKASVLLPHIKCGQISKLNTIDNIKDILKTMEFIPIIREINTIIHEKITNHTSESKGNEEEYEEGEFDVDWENEYEEIKANYEKKLRMMEKKFSIMKQLKIRNINVNEEREYTNEEENMMENIYWSKDVNGAIELFSKDPTLICGDFLHQCAHMGWKEGVELALDICFLSDEFINRKDSSGVPALIDASIRGHLEVVKCLIEKGANIEAKNNVGNTALMFACANGELEVVKYLIEKGANIEAKTEGGTTALMKASDNGYLEIVKCLVEKGANIEAKTKSGTTALTLASDNGYLEIVKYLVEKGANIDVENIYGETALTLASNKGHCEVVKYLKSIQTHSDRYNFGK